MSELPSYPKVWNIGHPSVRDLFDGLVVVQEKLDGSQFSAGIIGGQLHMRSRGAALYLETADKLFKPAVETFVRLVDEECLAEDWIYRGEALCRPKHNTLCYERAPEAGIILFDIDTGEEDRMDPEEAASHANALGLEFVPELCRREISSADDLRGLLDRESCLGGHIEGVVVKNYNRFGRDGKMLMGKLVTEQFKEVNRSDYRKRNPGRGDVLALLVDKYRTEARWRKAVERLRDAGQLGGSPTDIGGLIKGVQSDVLEECEHEIKQDLFDAFVKQIMRGSTRGLPEWYKQVLLESQFNEDAA